MSYSLQPHGLNPTSLLCLWNSSGKNTGMDCHFLLQGIFPTQRSNPGIPQCKQYSTINLKNVSSLVNWKGKVEIILGDFPCGASGKEPSCQCRLDIRDAGSIPGLRRSPGGGHSNPLQYSCMDNPMDRGAWQVGVHRVTQSWILKQLSMQHIP